MTHACTHAHTHTHTHTHTHGHSQIYKSRRTSSVGTNNYAIKSRAKSRRPLSTIYRQCLPKRVDTLPAMFLGEKVLPSEFTDSANPPSHAAVILTDIITKASLQLSIGTLDVSHGGWREANSFGQIMRG